MLPISQLLLSDRAINSFSELKDAVRVEARNERFLRMDIKPPFPDTPAHWEDVLEAAFSSPLPVLPVDDSFS